MFQSTKAMNSVSNQICEKNKKKKKTTTSQMIFFVTSSTLLLINHTVQADTYLVNMRMPILIMNCLWRCRSDAREEGWMCQVKLVFLNAKMIHYSFMNFIFDKTGKKKVLLHIIKSQCYLYQGNITLAQFSSP